MRKTSLLVVALLALSAGLITLTPAQGQTPPVPTEETRIYSFEVIPANGFAGITVFGGFDDGLLDVSCGGNTPNGGPVVPLAVMSTLRSHDILVRVVSWGPSGTIAIVNNARVVVSCAIDAPTTFWETTAVATKAAQLRQLARQ